MLRLDNLSIVSTGWRSKPSGGQAETLYFNSEGRMIATNSDFVSEQDTILVRGWSWFYHDLVAGNVDFIWGYNHATLFEEDEIRSLGDSTSTTKGGYIVQARTAGADDPGFVFLNSRLTHGPGPAGNDVPPGSSFLARPGTRDKVSYISCRIDRHIAPTGWSGQPHDATGWYEFNSMDMDGKPLDLSGRSGGQSMSANQAERFSSRARVFAGFDHGKGWTPSIDDAQ
jgi:pectin methylesterase-like acyl-CoA thioesterase